MRRFLASDAGQGLGEYAFILAILVLGLAVALSLAPGPISDKLEEIKTGLDSVTTT